MSTRRRGRGEGSIDRLSDGRWRARLSLGWHESGRIVQVFYGRTRAEVAQKMQEARTVRAVLAPDPGPPPPAVPTVRMFAENWLALAGPGLKPSSRRFYDGHLRNHILPILGDQPITSVRRSGVISLIRTCRSKGISVLTVRGITRTLSALLSDAAEQEILDSNPALNVRKHLRQGSETISTPDPFTTEECTTLLTTTDTHFPRWYAFVLCGLRTGMRLGELLALSWGDIDWSARTIRVRQNLVRGVLGTPKNHQARTVDMSPQLAIHLRLHRRQRRVEFLKHGMPLPSMVFPSTDGTYLDESNTRKMFTKICATAELRHRSPHDMRHTFASLLLSQNVPLLYVSGQMGHSSPAFTLKVYAHWMPKTDTTTHNTVLDTKRRTA